LVVPHVPVHAPLFAHDEYEQGIGGDGVGERRRARRRARRGGGRADVVRRTDGALRVAGARQRVARVHAERVDVAAAADLRAVVRVADLGRGGDPLAALNGGLELGERAETGAAEIVGHVDEHRLARRRERGVVGDVARGTLSRSIHVVVKQLLAVELRNRLPVVDNAVIVVAKRGQLFASTRFLQIETIANVRNRLNTIRRKEKKKGQKFAREGEKKKKKKMFFFFFFCLKTTTSQFSHVNRWIVSFTSLDDFV
jgi:hypothetical protein